MEYKVHLIVVFENMANRLLSICTLNFLILVHVLTKLKSCVCEHTC